MGSVGASDLVIAGAPSHAATVPTPKRAEPTRATAAAQDRLSSPPACCQDDDDATAGVASRRIAKFLVLAHALVVDKWTIRLDAINAEFIVQRSEIFKLVV